MGFKEWMGWGDPADDDEEEVEEDAQTLIDNAEDPIFDEVRDKMDKKDLVKVEEMKSESPSIELEGGKK